MRPLTVRLTGEPVLEAKRPSRQRGIYSEYLGESSDVTRKAATAGPNLDGPRSRVAMPPLQPPPAARTFARPNRQPPSGAVAASAEAPEKRGGRRIEPKVIAPFEQVPGMPPRRIEIERRTRLYANQDVEDLLRKEGVDYSRYGLDVDHLTGRPSYLPLDIFDDTEYESRTPQEWISLGTDESGNCAVDAKALRFDEGTGKWHRFEVVGFDEAENCFLGLWKKDSGSGGVVSVPRLHVCFRADNPFVFAKRVAAAHAARREFEAHIRYALYIDSMPTDDIQPLDTEQVNRILHLAANTRRLKSNALDATSLLTEVGIDYARTMNKIIFDVTLRATPLPGQQRGSAAASAQAATAMALRAQLQLPPSLTTEQPKPEPSYLGVVQVPFHDFPKHFSDFCFHSFYTKTEAISALVKVKAECLRLQKMTCFNTSITKSVSLADFEALQVAQMKQLNDTIKTKWTVALQNCILSSLRDVSKGWLNLKEQNREVYQFSKLKKFMTTVNLMMQAALRFLIQDSTRKYSAFLFNAAKYQVVVSSPSDVQVTTIPGDLSHALLLEDAESLDEKIESGAGDGTEGPSRSAAVAATDASGDPEALPVYTRDFPLFSVDLVLRDGRIQYTTSLDALLNTPLALIDKVLAMLQDIPVLEREVMAHLYLAKEDIPKINSVRKQEKWVRKMCTALQKRLTSALVPLHDYLEQYRRYDDLIKLDIDEYVGAFEQQKRDIKEMRQELVTHLKAKAQLEAEVPKTVSLGMAVVNCEDVRRKLSTKYKDLVTRLMDGYARVCKDQCEAIGNDFRKIEQELRRQPTNVLELVQLQAYMDTVPGRVAAFRAPIREVLTSLDMLEEFSYRIPKELGKLRWGTYGWPKAIHDQFVEKQAAMAQDRQQFLAELRSEQEAFRVELNDLDKRVNSFGSNTDYSKADKTYEKVEKILSKITELEGRAHEFNEKEMRFGLPATDYRDVQRLSKAFEPYQLLWSAAHLWKTDSEKWNRESFFSLNGDEMATKVAEFSKQINKALKSKVVRSSAALSDIAQLVKTQLDAFRPNLPLILALLNPGMRDRHWDALSAKLPFPFRPHDTITLNKVLNELKLGQHMEPIQKVSADAAKEYQLETALNKSEAAWKEMVFEVVPYKKTGTYAVKVHDEVIQLLDEQLVTTQAMQFSMYNKFFLDRIQRWVAKLNLVYEVIEEMLAVQAKWMSVEAVFNSEDIKRQLLSESRQFQTVNKNWRVIMQNAEVNREIIIFCDNPALLQKLKEYNKQLEYVSSRLTDYLDNKRAAFPRFYFLADRELLDILQRSQEPQAVQDHLTTCFESINALQFEPDLQITAMLSAEKEVVPFARPIDPRGKPVEHWLSEVERAMRDSVRAELAAAIRDYAARPRPEWVLKWTGQAVLTGSQYHWTMEVEAALRAQGQAGVRAYHAKLLEQLREMVSLLHEPLSDKQRLIMEALIVLDVHARDVVERLVQEECKDPSDFAWVCQMRYYLEEAAQQGNGAPAGPNMFVQMVQSRFPYAYEYLGNTSRLVITPLTDRCYITLMTALQLHMGGSPQGPAGTGKTETVKDLAKAVAKKCVVFNCSEDIKIQAMVRMFKGLANSGAWACFDEFNRIDVEVLSVIAQQIGTIWQHIRQKDEQFIFEGTPIRLDPTCSVFITMNPDYIGRTELPDNLKALFRPVAMMVPDYTLIAQIMLYSYGFQQAQTLARKLTATFKLSSEQLSTQGHYDYGMRAVKAVITRAGLLKRQSKEMDENQLLLRALRDENVPKFLKIDLPLFESIISDLFPKVARPEQQRDTLVDALKAACEAEGLQPVDSFLEKCLQLYDTHIVRHGLMVVGPAGGGKTSTIQVLAKAITRLAGQAPYDAVRTHIINPKAVTNGILYGDYDKSTQHFVPGILPRIVKQVLDGELGTDKQWIVFDGPVDPDWIESMNSALDDNKKLCLPDGTWQFLPPQMRLMFEVADLSQASPATVSRCGMVYLEPEALGLKPLLRSWADKLTALDALRASLLALLETYVEPAVQFVRKHCTEPVPSVDVSLVKSMLSLLDCLIAPHLPKAASVQSAPGLAPFLEEAPEGGESKEDVSVLQSHLEPLVVMALVWSVGATTDKAGRQLFSTWLRARLADADCKEAPPAAGLVYDYMYTLDKGWTPWTQLIPNYTFDASLSFQELIVPTADTVRYTFLLDSLLRSGKPVLFTGNTGTGKTVHVNQWLSKLPDIFIPLRIVFSAATTSEQVEDLVFNPTYVSRRRPRAFGPTLGKRLVVFLDDMNMPARTKYFAQPPLELLRQWLDNGAWWDRKQLQYNDLLDVNFVGAMGPPGGGRNPVSRRILRHFTQVAHTDLENTTLCWMFNTIVRNCLARFKEDIKSQTDKLVEATVSLFEQVASELRPTPSKSHYTFNLRDLSAVFQGVVSTSPRRITTLPTLLRLWVHECRRVFQDRLVNGQDRTLFDDMMASRLKTQWDASWDELVPKDQPLLFGDYIGGINSEQRIYDEVKELPQAIKAMDEYLSEYNEEQTPMKLVLFADAVEHVSRISRILRQPGGNALLLGVGGSGRQSLTRLATYMAEYELFTIEASKRYGVVEWREDIKKMLLDAGLKEQPTVFLLSDTQLTHREFIEDVNSMLNTGDVPNLYSAEDMDNIFATCKVDCQRKNLPATKLNAYIQFVTRIRQNLHIVLCMSPIGDAFRTRLRMFPSLVNCCTIDWFSDWPLDALLSVATSALQEEDLKLDSPQAVVNTFAYIHRSVIEKSAQYADELRRYNYVTPTSYLELINVFKWLLSDKRSEIGGSRSKLQGGLDTLRQAQETAAKMQADLREDQPKLVETAQQVEATMQQILVDTKEVETKKEVVVAQEAEVSAKAAECKRITDEAQAELDRALPMLDKAIECLSELKRQDIEELRQFSNPPPGVVLTMEAACIMLKGTMNFKVKMKADPVNLGKQIPQYWETAKKYLLRQPRVLLDTLRLYDRNNIPKKVIEEIKPYVMREDFQVKKIESVSLACRAICMWVHAMYNYYHVDLIVQPKRLRLQAAEEELDKVNQSLNETKERLDALQSRLTSLEETHKALLESKQELEEKVELCQLKLDRATTLINLLGGEKDRWMTTLAQLEASSETVVGDVLLSAGTIAYLGAFTGPYRNALLADWRAKLATEEVNIRHTEGCNIRSALGDPLRIRGWNLAGLPTDAVSIENGIIMSKSRRWPLMIDPQGQASKFIKRLGEQMLEEEKVKMDVIKLTDPDFLRTLEGAVRYGRWVLIEDVHEELDPAMEHLLLQQIVSVRGVPHIKLGDGEPIPYDDHFHLYMCTKLPNPHYAPELQVKVTLLNFTITPEGLEDQMLGTVVQKESAELEQKKLHLQTHNARMKQTLQDKQEEILRLLSEKKGDVLENEDVINKLSDAKRASDEVNEKVAEAELVEKDIDEARSAYAVVAKRASILYFCIADLAIIDPMYQYSLQWYVDLFERCITKLPKADGETPEQRLTNIIDAFTKTLSENVCRSLFEAHKPLFVFLLAVRILQGDERVRPAEWRFLVAGAAAIKNTPNPATLDAAASAWLTDNVWTQILALSDLETFGGFEADFRSRLPEWKAFFESSEPQSQPLPGEWEDRLDAFQKLLVLKCLRPDKVLPAVQDFVASTLGKEYVNYPQFNLAHSFRDSTCVTPLIFILSRGADPASRFVAFADQMGYRDKYVSISLGQGQGDVAARHIEQAKKSGRWVLLQNCHLLTSWLPTLAQLVDKTRPEETHPDYRLWLTSFPTKAFPVSVLQSGVKMTNEPPKGLRQNLRFSYDSFSDALFNKSKSPKDFKKLLFSLCFFHAVVLDRRKFGPLGWNVKYDFTENDLQVTVLQLMDFLDMYAEQAVPYKVIHFLVSEINYGGRVTDDVDRRTMATILADFVNPGVLSDDYKFSPSGRYTSIPTGTREHYLKYISTMDATPAPEVFGMHDNADITSAQQDTADLFATLLGLLPRKSHDAVRSREQIIQEHAASIAKRLPAPWDVEAVSEKYPTTYAESMNTVLVQETIRYNRLLGQMHSSLRDLGKALNGDMVMTSELERMSDSLFNNTVPEMWAAVAYPSLMDLAHWVVDLEHRLAFIQRWIDHGIPNVFWISGFFFPQAFLTGTLQNFARRYTKPIDAVSFGFRVLDAKPDSITERPSDGVYITGLFLEGARWDSTRQSLAESRPRELYTPMPVLWLLPEEERKASATGVYRCPVYKTLTRSGQLSTTGHSTNFVLYIELPTLLPPSKWIKAGVALFCALRY